jgi:hypothetical protein
MQSTITRHEARFQGSQNSTLRYRDVPHADPIRAGVRIGASNGTAVIIGRWSTRPHGRGLRDVRPMGWGTSRSVPRVRHASPRSFCRPRSPYRVPQGIRPAPLGPSAARPSRPRSPDEAAFMTGVLLAVDGGQSLKVG